MSESPRVFTPLNRRLVLSLNQVENKTKSGVLLPAEYSQKREKYEKVTVLSVASDCAAAFLACEGRSVFVEKSMIEKIRLGGREVHMILENYVLGVCSVED